MAQTVTLIVCAEDRARLAAIIGDRNRPLKHAQRARGDDSAGERSNRPSALYDPRSPMLSLQTEQIAAISGCYGNGVKPWASGITCGHSVGEHCHMAAAAAPQAADDIYTVFPKPTFSSMR